MLDDSDTVPTRFHVILNYRPLGLVRATAKSVTGRGLTVDTGCILLPNGAEVEITFSFRSASGRHRVQRLDAVVTRSGPAETRLEVSENGGSDLSAVQQYLYGRVPAGTMSAVAGGLPA